MHTFVDVKRSSRRVAVLILMAATGVATAPTGGSAAEDVPSAQGVLSSTQWSASAFSHHAAGTVCWIFDADGSLRVELRLDPESQGTEGSNQGDLAPVDLAPLLNRAGDGWTLVLGPDDIGTLNAWDREWREVPGGLAQMVRLVTTSLEVFPGRPPDHPPVRAVGLPGRTGAIPQPRFNGARPPHPQGPEVWRYQLAALDLQDSEQMEASGFRRNMVARGRGTGGRGEILVLQWRPDGQGGYGLNLHSSRRPGELSLQPPQRQGVPQPEPEVFLPLWPLSQFFEIR